MANLWIFGDSFSEACENMFLRNFPQGHYISSFYKINKRFPIHFSDIIKEHFKLDRVFNFGQGSSSNQTILESIGKNITKIKEDDFVCIGWTNISRFRFPYDINNTSSKWADYIIGSGLYPSKEHKSDIHSINKRYKEYFSIFDEMCLNREDLITLEEIKNWQNILKLALPFKTVFWSPFRYINRLKNLKNHISFELIPDTIFIETIRDASNIEDIHYSENGYKTVGEFLIRCLEDIKKTPKNLLI